jgi:AraC-like DNA-binding protein
MVADGSVPLDRRQRAIVAYLKETPACEWSVSAMEKCARVSPSHLRRLFIAGFGVPPHRYVRRQRLALAAELLVNSCLSVKEIAQRAGVGDISHFTRDFIAQFGCPPGRYARRVVQVGE